MKTKIISSTVAVLLFVVILCTMPALSYANDSTLVANTWINMAPAVSPLARGWGAMAYDSESDRMILFGGGTGWYVTNDETWAYDYNTNAWTNMNPTQKPSARVRYGVAYDSKSDRVILFGGSSGTWPETFYDETWAYDYNTNTWTNMNPTVKPSPRQAHVMVYDSESDRVILFGGELNVIVDGFWAFDGETWTYDYDTNTWTNMNPSTSPSGRAEYGMAYDSKNDKAILFGGFTYPYPTFNDETWAYDYNTNMWTEMNPLASSPARARHTMAYDSQSDRVILFGGDTGGWSDETWTYDYNANAWANMNPTVKPASRGFSPMAYDSESDKTVLFGGFPGWTDPYSDEWYYGDTWIYDLVYSPDPKALLEELKTEINGLPSAAFRRPRFAEYQKRALCKHINAITRMVDAGKYRRAILLLRGLKLEVGIQIRNPWKTTLIGKVNTIIDMLESMK